MQIKSLKIKGLFGTFNYNIKFPVDNQLFIITGCNGYGKTTILNIINSLGSNDLYYFFLLRFKEIEFTFFNRNILRIEKTNENIEESKDGIKVSFIFYANKGRKGHSLEIKESTIIKKLKKN